MQNGPASEGKVSIMWFTTSWLGGASEKDCPMDGSYEVLLRGLKQCDSQSTKESDLSDKYHQHSHPPGVHPTNTSIISPRWMGCRLSLVHRDTPSLSTPTLASGCVNIDHVKGSLTPEHLLHHHSHDQSEEGARGLKGSDGIGIPGGNLGIGTRCGITFIKCGRLGSASKDDSNGLLVGNLAAKTEGIGLETGGLGAIGALTGTVACLAGTVTGAAGATGTLRVGASVPGGATGGVFTGG